MKHAALGGADCAKLNPSSFLFGLFLFLIISHHMCLEATLALRVLCMLNKHINSLGQSLALNLLFSKMPTACWVML